MSAIVTLLSHRELIENLVMRALAKDRAQSPLDPRRHRVPGVDDALRSQRQSRKVPRLTFPQVRPGGSLPPVSLLSRLLFDARILRGGRRLRHSRTL